MGVNNDYISNWGHNYKTKEFNSLDDIRIVDVILLSWIYIHVVVNNTFWDVSH